MIDLFKAFINTQMCPGGISCKYCNPSKERHRGASYAKSKGKLMVNKIARSRLKQFDIIQSKVAS